MLLNEGRIKAMGYSTLNCLFLLISCILVNFRLNTAQYCFGTNSTSDSQYGVNRNKILSSLASTVRDNGGFYTGREGEGSDMVYALGLCRGELDSENCFSCINSSGHAIIEKCTYEKEATDFGQSSSCIVRCSDKSVGSINDISTARLVYSTINIADNADEFDQALSSLVDSLVDTAADSTVPRSKFAKDTKKFSEYQTIYAIMECIPSLTPSHCRDCLRQAVSYYTSCCTRTKGAIFLLPSCIFQYDLDPFFEVHASQSPPPPVDTYAPSTPPTMITKQDNKSRKLRTAIIVAVPTSITLLLIGSTFFLLRKRIKNSKTAIPSKDDESIGLPIFNVATITEATNNFSRSNKIGEGGFGPVFKGQLSTGQLIAVKRNSEKSNQGLREFKNEVTFIAKLQHRNLVRLLGCCIEGEERMLIYEYMPNGSLNSFIFENRSNPLAWSRRLEIIVGIARGILYLHRDSRLRIVHRDLKASNVLLDDQMNPKIADFGLARAFRGDQQLEKTGKVVGTYGYMSPEYVMDGLFSMKSDVYSFGVLVLEIVSGKRNREFFHPDHGLTLLGHAWKLWIEGKALELVHEQMGDFPIPETLKCIQVGLLCVQQHPEDRPTMPSVLLALDSESPMLPQPKQPGFYTERSSTETKPPSSGNQSTTTNEMSLTVLSGR